MLYRARRVKVRHATLVRVCRPARDVAAATLLVGRHVGRRLGNRYTFAGSWVVACARFLLMARYWSHSVAWFKDVEFKSRRRNKKTQERLLRARKRQTPRLFDIVREDAARARIALPQLTAHAAAAKLAAHRKVTPARSEARPALIRDSSSHSQQPVEHIPPSGGAASGGLLKPSDPPSMTTDI